MRISSLFIFLFLISFSLLGKTNIEIITTGTGATLDEAKNNALRSALEQVSGFYFSAHTELINNVIEENEIKSITQGTIVSFKILSKTNLDGLFYLTIKSKISPQNFTKFINERSSTSISIDGESFVSNVQQNKLNFEAEKAVLDQLNEICNKEMVKFYTFKLKSKEPIVRGDNVILTVEIDLRLKQKFKHFRKWILSTIREIGIKKNQIKQIEKYGLSAADFNYYRLMYFPLIEKYPETKSIVTRNDLRKFLNPYATFNFKLFDGFSYWNPVFPKTLTGNNPKISWESDTYKSDQYCQTCLRTVSGELSQAGQPGFSGYGTILNSPALLSWPIPHQGDKNSILIKLTYSIEEFEKVKGIEIIPN